MAVPRMPQRPSIPVECRPAHPTAWRPVLLTACRPAHPDMCCFCFLPPGALRIPPRASFRFLPRGTLRFLSSASSTMLRVLFLRDAEDSLPAARLCGQGTACSIHIGAPDLHAAGLHALDMHAVGCSVVGEAHSTRAGAADRTWSAVNHRALDGESTRPPGTGSPNLSPQAACRACVRRGRHRAPALHG